MDWTTNARNINNETVPISMYVKSITFEDGKITVTAVNGNEAESKDYAVLTMSNTAPTLATVGIKGSFWVHKHDNINDLYYLFNIETSEEGLLSYIWNKISGGVVVDTAMSTTSTNPVENQAITKAINEIRNVAEGKNKGYVLSNTHDWQYVKSNSSTYGLIKWINNGGVVTDITSVVKDPSITVQYLKENYGDASNSYFAINVDEITINSNLIIMEQGQSQIAIINTKNFKIGDVFYVIEKNVPDRWTDGSFNFYALETKSDLGNYYTKAQTDEKITGLTNNIDDEIDRATAEEDRLDGLIDSLDSTKAGTEYVNTELAKKAGTEYVNTELAKKVNTTLETNKLYGTNGTGAQTTFKVNVDVEEYSVAYRGVNGTLKVATPTNNNEATPKSYVDLSQIPFTDDYLTDVKVGYLTAGTNLKNKTVKSILIGIFTEAGFFSADDELLLGWDESGVQADVDYTVETHKAEGSKSLYKIIKDYNDTYTTKIAKIKMPKSLTRIGDYSAASLSTYVRSIKWSPNITEIGNSGFFGNYYLDIGTLPSSLKTIKEKGFYGINTKNMVIPDSVEYIASNCFKCNPTNSGTVHIETFYLGSGCTTFADNNLSGQTKLTEIKVNPANTTFTSQDESGNECNCIMTADRKIIKEGCKNTVILDSVEQLNSYSFAGRIPTSINLNKVKKLDKYCLADNSFTEITIPDTVTYLGYGCLANCTALTTVHMKPTTPPQLYANAFDGCTALTKIYVPTGSLTTYQSATNWSAYASIMEEE